MHLHLKIVAPNIHLSCLHRSALDGLMRIARNEGPGVLWRGTDLSLLVAVPMVAMYFPLYDSLLQRCQNAGVSLLLLHCNLMCSCMSGCRISSRSTMLFLHSGECFRLLSNGHH